MKLPLQVATANGESRRASGRRPARLGAQRSALSEIRELRVKSTPTDFLALNSVRGGLSRVR